jgi:hypothetical protein
MTSAAQQLDAQGTKLAVRLGKTPEGKATRLLLAVCSHRAGGAGHAKRGVQTAAAAAPASRTAYAAN